MGRHKDLCSLLEVIKNKYSSYIHAYAKNQHVLEILSMFPN